MTTDPTQDPASFWEEFYLTRRTPSNGSVTGALQRIAAGLTPGASLDLGASHGDDVIWLAERGWNALGCDISGVAVERARTRAAELGLAEQAVFQCCDLSLVMPEGPFDLVTALYLQSPVALQRTFILEQAVARLRPGGHLLVVSHAAPPPWTPKATASTVFPSLDDELASIATCDAPFNVIEARVVMRNAKGPDGQPVSLKDNLVLVRRSKT